MTPEQSIEEAKHLKQYVDNIWKSIYDMPKFKESEVNFRAETLRGFILILSSDIYEMLKEWQAEQTKEVGE